MSQDDSPTSDDRAWLTRLSREQWLAAADNELASCEATLQRRAHRPAVTHARRAAGMALNAVLLTDETRDWGRSYMDHLRAVANDEGVEKSIQQAAECLLVTPPAPPKLVSIGAPDDTFVAAAREIVNWARRQLN